MFIIFKGILTNAFLLKELLNIKYFYISGFKVYTFPSHRGYSDLLIIPEDNLKLFCHLCGIFAGMNLWVDAAIAASLTYHCEKITQERSRFGESWDPIGCKNNFKAEEGSRK